MAGNTMLTQGQSRAAIVFCLLLILVLLVLNLRYNSLTTLTCAPSLVTSSSNKPEINQNTVEKYKKDNEQTLNKELQGIRTKGFPNNLRDVVLEQLSEEELSLTIHSYLDNTDVTCSRKLRMGNLGDGGWEICDDPDLRPRVPCIVYSFGISNDFSFDDDVSMVYGCHVYCFDPSMQVADRYDRSNLVHFFKLGLSNKKFTNSQKWAMDTFAGIRTLLGHQQKKIDILKMDIESSEWEALPEMVSAGQMESIGQLMVEYHVVGTSRDQLLSMLRTIQAVERSGFKKYYVHKNPACGVNIKGFPVKRTQCYEIHYIRR